MLVTRKPTLHESKAW